MQRSKRTSCMWKRNFGDRETCSYKNSKYVGNMIGNSVVECDEIIDTTKTIPPKSTSTKNVPIKSTLTNFYILLAFLLITIALLIAVNIYLIKHQSKQKNLLTFTTPRNLNNLASKTLRKWKGTIN